MRARSLALPLPLPLRSVMSLALPCLSMALLLAGCDTSANAGVPAATATNTRIVAPSATPTVALRAVKAYTCATESLPVNQGYTRTSCAITTPGNYHLLRASYTGETNSYFVNEQRLVADGWVSVQQEHGDSPYGAIGDAVYTGAGGWFAFYYDIPTGNYSIEQGIPISPQAAGSCGQTLSAGTAKKRGIPLPANSLTPDNSTYIIVPACLDDLQRFYSAVLPSAGWTIVQPFQSAPEVQPSLVASFAIVSNGSNTNLQIVLGSDGTIPTIIAISSYGP